MFEQAISKTTKSVLAVLAEKKVLPPNTYLAGGTALALQIGHRISYDLDFFTREKFDAEKLVVELRKVNDFKLERTAEQTVLGGFPEIKFSVFHYPYQLLKQPVDFLGIELASLGDLAASKINAVSARGKKRDFVDLYYLLPKIGALDKFLELYDKRFKNLSANRAHIIKSLEYFEDADQDKDPEMLVGDYSWEKVKDRLREEVLKFARTETAD